MNHHITVKGVPLCKAPGLNTVGIYCNHLTMVRAKTAVLRLVEANPTFPICHYAVEPGVCGVVNTTEVGE